MILLALYAIAVWVGVAVWRRRWLGFALLVGSLLPLAAFTVWAGYMGSEPGAAARMGFIGTLAGYGRVIYMVSGFYAALLFGVGAVIFAQPRRLGAHQCEGCGYDLRGSGAERCPECGREASSVDSNGLRADLQGR